MTAFGERAVGVQKHSTVLVANEETRCHRVYADAVAVFQSHLHCHPLCEVGHSGLCCRVARHVGHRLQSSHRRNVHHCALLLFCHNLANHNRRINGSVHIQVGNLVPVLNFHIEDRLVGAESGARHIAASNVDKDVDAAPFLNHLVGHSLNRIDVQNVANQAHCLAVADGVQFLDAFVELLLTDVESHNLCASAHKTFGHAATQNATCARDNGNLAFNAVHLTVVVHNTLILNELFMFFLSFNRSIV